MEEIPIDNLEAFFEDLQRNLVRANLTLAPEQEAVTWGSTWARFYGDVVIFGRAHTHEQLVTEETRGITDIDDEEEGLAAAAEAAYTITRIEESLADGFVYGWCDSTVTESMSGSELGSTHKSNLWPISEALYEAAREVAWDPNKLRPIFELELAQAFQAYVAWLRRVAVSVQENLGGGDPHGDR